jgi:hypothetical protein
MGQMAYCIRNKINGLGLTELLGVRVVGRSNRLAPTILKAYNS